MNEGRRGCRHRAGKIEFESQTLKRFDPDDPERPPVPHYIASWEGTESYEILKKYPLQLISPHPRFTSTPSTTARACGTTRSRTTGGS